jgi:hypothetical protein
VLAFLAYRAMRDDLETLLEVVTGGAGDRS